MSRILVVTSCWNTNSNEETDGSGCSAIARMSGVSESGVSISGASMSASISGCRLAASWLPPWVDKLGSISATNWFKYDSSSIKIGLTRLVVSVVSSSEILKVPCNSSNNSDNGSNPAKRRLFNRSSTLMLGFSLRILKKSSNRWETCWMLTTPNMVEPPLIEWAARKSSLTDSESCRTSCKFNTPCSIIWRCSRASSMK